MTARAVVLLGMALAAPAAGQGAAGAILVDSVRVGDIVPVAVRLTVTPGDQAVLPPVLPLEGPDLENAARVRERADTLADGTVRLTGVYSVTPWRTGSHPLPDVVVRVRGGDDEWDEVVATLPALEVVSVLPADADALQPMPARGVIGPSYVWWPFLLLAAALLAAAAFGWWWARRRRPAPAVAAAPALPPRERALAALQEARDAGLVERGEWKEFYTRVAHALREYLEALDPAWSEDLTTTELLARVRADAGLERAGSIGELLRPADQVKFARRVPAAAEALEEWERARAWVQAFEWPPPARFAEVAA